MIIVDKISAGCQALWAGCVALCSKVYRAWFSVIAGFADWLRPRSRALSAGVAVVGLESHALVRATWDTYVRYRKAPEHYGFNTDPEDAASHGAIVLMHGAVGSWNYMGDLATRLLNEGYAVYAINVTPEFHDWRMLGALNEICAKTDHKVVTIVAHSDGANVAAKHLRHAVIADKVEHFISVAMPLSQETLDAIQPRVHTHAILAEFDAVVDNGINNVADTQTLSAAHLGIVNHADLVKCINHCMQSFGG